MGQFKESTMKSFAFVCLFAAAYAAPAADADAEADPALLYSSLGYGGYTGYAGYHHPYTYGAAAPVVTYNAVHHASPVVYNTAAHVASPVVYNTVAAPMSMVPTGGRSTASTPIPMASTMATMVDTTTRVPADAALLKAAQTYGNSFMFPHFFSFNQNKDLKFATF